MPVHGYQPDLAYIHDVGFGGFARQAAPAIIDALRQGGIGDGLVVDLGCGSGGLTRELAAAGYEVLGIDYSAAMLKIARRHVPQARFLRASFLDVALPPCCAVAAVGEVLNYLFDGNNRQPRIRGFFQRVYDALQPGGVFIFDVAGPGRAGGPGKRQRIAQGDDWATLVEVEEDSETAILTRHITAFRRVGKLYRRSEEVHRLQLHRSRDVIEALREVGFQARRLPGYGDFRLPRGWAVIQARRK